ncbi:MAG: metalloregulator ArsR/SmtB family transcription factor [candidate division Zixibacteria bacterium]|nr:metalloregulator ArsR/SmtB family transcription factor [candidate division Zixibacteria bacterium]MDH3936986.1 metalloregulator ArsR/SmtB family transcription factor [candidate division Zixibacteria bacterium]
MARKMDEKTYSKYFKAFGDPTRLRILALLVGGERTVNDIVKQVGLSQPTVSRHLSILREADIVVDRRDGQQVFYSLNKISVESCCSGFCDCLSIPVKPVKFVAKAKRK